jgi:hypothetical protein
MTYKKWWVRFGFVVMAINLNQVYYFHLFLNVIFEGLFSLVLVSRCDCLDGEDDDLVSSKSHPALILSRLCLVWHC